MMLIEIVGIGTGRQPQIAHSIFPAAEKTEKTGIFPQAARMLCVRDD
jgi:hypothetical protein